ncbi:hypothetical protein ACTRXD_00365 [Nitrospira sp. T9]|uniref:hypothetical protein n=1 Tax=unclassified Nitrospira TaxID=2652172 RepID=UPI003F96A461
MPTKEDNWTLKAFVSATLVSLNIPLYWYLANSPWPPTYTVLTLTFVFLILRNPLYWYRYKASWLISAATLLNVWSIYGAIEISGFELKVTHQMSIVGTAMFLLAACYCMHLDVKSRQPILLPSEPAYRDKGLDDFKKDSPYTDLPTANIIENMEVDNRKDNLKEE